MPASLLADGHTLIPAQRLKGVVGAWESIGSNNGFQNINRAMSIFE
jgi:hypothetical protein